MTHGNPILVDERVGSGNMVGLLRHWSVPVDCVRLDYGDAAFIGNGPTGPIRIGIEIKAVRDAVACMIDGRFASRQLPGLVEEYEKVWLLVEGPYTADNNTGLLLAGVGKNRKEVAFGQRRFMYRELSHWISTMEICAGIRVRNTFDRLDSARFIAMLYSWYAKPYDKHQSHVALSEQDNFAMLAKPSLIRRVAAQLPGIGFTKSEAVAKHFGTVANMANSEESDWMKIEGIGLTIAQRVIKAIYGD